MQLGCQRAARVNRLSWREDRAGVEMRTGVCLAFVTSVLLTVANAQAACVAVPPEKIGFQLYNMLSVMIPPDKIDRKSVV